MKSLIKMGNNAVIAVSGLVVGMGEEMDVGHEIRHEL
jgi:hypothetical protein